jgi:hypothetical protein
MSVLTAANLRKVMWQYSSQGRPRELVVHLYQVCIQSVTDFTELDVREYNGITSYTLREKLVLISFCLLFNDAICINNGVITECGTVGGMEFGTVNRNIMRKAFKCKRSRICMLEVEAVPYSCSP